MARKRMIDPEFWSDEKVGCLSLLARLIFIGLWNFADDEGLSRFNEPFIKANIFPYDNILLPEIRKGMDELITNEFVFEYKGGLTQQMYAYIINFHKHQRIDKPQPSKLPPPSIQNPKVKQMYFKRDDYICYICHKLVDLMVRNDLPHSKFPSLDHINPRISGGSDYPTNIKTAHISCNKSKGDESFQESFQEPLSEIVPPNIKEINIREVNIKEQPSAVKTVLDKVYKDGLNIYSLINRLKKELGWTKDRQFPDQVLLKVCEQYWKDKPKKPWAWFVRVIKMESANYSAQQNIAEHEKLKKEGMPESLKAIFRSL